MINEEKKTEARIQAECFKWFWNTYPHLRRLLYHVPNGEKRDVITASKLQAMGVVSGIPDMELHYRARTYFFEFKKDKSAKLSKAQEKVIQALEEQRFIVYEIRDFETFCYIVEGIVKGTSEQVTFGLTKEDYFYRHKVFSYLYSLGDGQLVAVADVCEEENIGKFVNCITEFISEGYDALEGFEILFTPDYEAFYKKLEGSEVEVIYKHKKYH